VSAVDQELLKNVFGANLKVLILKKIPFRQDEKFFGFVKSVAEEETKL
jgi:hypothetical protein